MIDEPKTGSRYSRGFLTGAGARAEALSGSALAPRARTTRTTRTTAPLIVGQGARRPRAQARPASISPPRRGLHPGRVPGGRAPIRPQHGAALLPGESDVRRREPLLRDGL